MSQEQKKAAAEAAAFSVFPPCPAQVTLTAPSMVTAPSAMPITGAVPAMQLPAARHPYSRRPIAWRPNVSRSRAGGHRDAGSVGQWRRRHHHRRHRGDDDGRRQTKREAEVNSGLGGHSRCADQDGRKNHFSFHRVIYVLVASLPSTILDVGRGRALHYIGVIWARKDCAGME